MNVLGSFELLLHLDSLDGNSLLDAPQDPMEGYSIYHGICALATNLTVVDVELPNVEVAEDIVALVHVIPDAVQSSPRLALCSLFALGRGDGKVFSETRRSHQRLVGQHATMLDLVPDSSLAEPSSKGPVVHLLKDLDFLFAVS